ncbi:copper resistance system multicopper oxidase [Parafrankia sp. BMG5.11]|uniref:copper resistance system multicopper oxidase n=1 Tax=Parafrankia sp. BMG5.11 TaxID=222540 RepID=UPI00103F9074|nr:copper resistance system multicopper oxidase [Parafrankia sp. BMG5.11]TCJ38888.1 copper resistance system multicopper oxidase [Parafrankia sp. BMG5.11]
MSPLIHRRALLRGGAIGVAGLGASRLFPAWAQTGSHGLAAKASPTITGEDIRLTVAESAFQVDGRTGHAITINGTIPAPLIRLREGQNVRIVVDNQLDEDTSIHWHGLIVPFQMDGVPGVSFPGIAARSTFTYEFPLRQSGTYWYHSHSGLQEQLGHYGPMIIDPVGADPVAYDREHVIVLSDWSFMHPHRIFSRMKAEGGFFNRQKETLLDQRSETLSAEDRLMFARMRMDPSDISDVTEAAYTLLINGHSPDENWTGIFRPGERVRLRIINAAAQTTFNFRIPGLPMTFVATDGINMRPVEVDEVQIGNAETYDFIVEPRDHAYTIVAESIDRSGMARATLAPRMGMVAAVPPLRERPTLNMTDMGMGGMDHGSMDHGAAPAAPGAMDHSAMGHGTPAASGVAAGAGSMAGMDHSSMDMRDASQVDFPVGVGVDMIAPNPVDRTGHPGIGLENVGHRVLTYSDMASLTPNRDTRTPTRRIDIHLTGNMERFMWSMDGEQLSENPEPYRFARNERARLRLINDTMMTHPMHLHGHFFEIVNGQGASQPLKHTVKVMPGGFVDLDLTADAPGDWAFHCHLLYHMHAGMMRVVTVRPLDGGAA